MQKQTIYLQGSGSQLLYCVGFQEMHLPADVYGTWLGSVIEITLPKKKINACLLTNSQVL